MKSFLLVFDPNNHYADSHFLGSVHAAAEKQEKIEWLSDSVYMIPEDKFLSFVSAIAVLISAYTQRPISHGGQSSMSYGYKILTIPEDAQWLHFGGSQQ